jgi:hypothetical protein
MGHCEQEKVKGNGGKKLPLTVFFLPEEKNLI